MCTNHSYWQEKHKKTWMKSKYDSGVNNNIASSYRMKTHYNDVCENHNHFADPFSQSFLDNELIWFILVCTGKSRLGSRGALESTRRKDCRFAPIYKMQQALQKWYFAVVNSVEKQILCRIDTMNNVAVMLMITQMEHLTITKIEHQTFCTRLFLGYILAL